MYIRLSRDAYHWIFYARLDYEWTEVQCSRAVLKTRNRVPQRVSIIITAWKDGLAGRAQNGSCHRLHSVYLALLLALRM
jgi:hypothetical protein